MICHECACSLIDLGNSLGKLLYTMSQRTTAFSLVEPVSQSVCQAFKQNAWSAWPFIGSAYYESCGKMISFEEFL